MTDARGFTFVEVLVGMVIFAVIVSLSVPALRHYWLVQALDGATDEVVTQLRQAHTRSTSESHPRVYGARFREGASEWDIVLYNPETDECERDRTVRFDAGVFNAPVEVSAASFAGESDGNAACSQEGWAAEGDAFVFFYARGSATAGSVTLRQPTLDRTRTVTVTQVTGRVARQ